MCDTFYFKSNNYKYFMKNSDRSPNEPNLIRFYERKKVTDKETKCTYISIPSIKETYACLLIQPSWMYGAEMGINEYGLSIGNEAVFTKNKDNKTERLIGMDYLRLALERCKTSKEASHFIIDTLKLYGQGGNCGYDHKFYYDNSYLIMDKDETYILETVGYDYCLYKALASYNISNKLSLNKEYIESSKEYKNFQKDNSDFFFTTGSMSRNRECDGRKLLNEKEVSMLSAIEILSHHRVGSATSKGDVGSICMHKNMLGDHTTSSMIVDYNYENPTIWLSGSPSPCISVFKPYYFGYKCDLIKNTKEESLEYYYKRMWLNRIVLSGLVPYKEYKEKVDALNNKFISKEKELRENNSSLDELIQFSNECYKEEESLVNEYNDLIDKVKNGEIQLKGIWKKQKISSNPFSSSLVERLK